MRGGEKEKFKASDDREGDVDSSSLWRRVGSKENCTNQSFDDFCFPPDHRLDLRSCHKHGQIGGYMEGLPFQSISGSSLFSIGNFQRWTNRKKVIASTSEDITHQMKCESKRKLVKGSGLAHVRNALEGKTSRFAPHAYKIHLGPSSNLVAQKLFLTFEHTGKVSKYICLQGYVQIYSLWD